MYGNQYGEFVCVYWGLKGRADVREVGLTVFIFIFQQ